MSKGRSILLAVIACGSLVTATGCTRTSDGSVVMKTPSMPGMFARQPDQPSYVPDQPSVALAELPPAPRAPASPRRARAVPPMGTWKVQTVKAPFERTDPEKPLNCRNETSAQGRVKMTCL